MATHRTSTVETVDVEGITTAASAYPSASRVGDWVFVSGQVSFDDTGCVFAPGDFSAQARQSLDRLRRVLENFGGDLRDVAAATVYVTNPMDAGALNDIWREYFGAHRPARATVVAQLLVPGLEIEIQSTAFIPAGERAAR